ncbi:uncharacterized protein LOC128234397 [Mya arenaria]|uniref:uncharacterized protein LOC128234397 n=1 Tax=Mya arenaria TaxID=6604 RepID=UPI0022E0AAF6|nr:uncharacterized protein LOC128234397 [Mya arenaria]
MAAPMACSPATLMAIKLQKCEHGAERQVMKAVQHGCTASEVFEELHGPTNPKLFATKYEAPTSLGPGGTFWQIEPTTRMGDLIASFDVKVIRLSCTLLPKGGLMSTLQNVSEEATAKTVNAFEVLMMGRQASIPSKKTSSSGVQTGLNRKDELFNDIVDLCDKMGAKFSQDTVESDGRYFVQVLCNSLWYITNQMDTINEAARQQKDVNPVPELFYNFCGYNETKRKKQKSQPMSSRGLRSDAECLFGLLNKPYLNSTVGNWPELRLSIEALASCLSSYGQYLYTQSNTSAKNKVQPHPCRTVDQNASVYHCSKSVLCVVKDKYKVLDKAVTSVDIGNPVLFDEDLHIDKPFENTMQRFRFFDNLQLSVSVDVIKYCPGGGVGTTFIISQVPENRSEPQMMTDAARLVQRMRGSLKEFHTRSQKKEFKRKVSNIAKVQPSLLDYMYSELALDASAFDNPDMQQRLHVMSLGESGLVNDLRHLNPGRPNDRYDSFFEKLCELVEDNSAADERRHGSGVAHLSRWISLSDMIKETVSLCPEETPVPSKSLVCLQFAPRNPYASTALTFTSRIPVQYKYNEDS